MQMRVLLVDDEEELVTTLAERLTLRGLHVDWATGGEGALQLARSNPYDIAVLDVKIPKISGIKLKNELVKLSPGMKFIFVTGHGSEDDFRAGTTEAGAGYYLVKPVNIDILIQKMNEVLGDKGGQ
jgi:DNA-binding response OmpR family regulator